MRILHKKLISTLIIAATFAAIFSNSQFASAVPPKINLTPSDYTTGMTWEKAQKQNTPIVVNFYVDWCHFCQGFAPILDKLRQQTGSKYSFVFINCEDPKNESLVRNFNIQSYPSLFLVKKNKKIQIDNSKFQNIYLLKEELDKFSK